MKLCTPRRLEVVNSWRTELLISVQCWKGVAVWTWELFIGGSPGSKRSITDWCCPKDLIELWVMRSGESLFPMRLWRSLTGFILITVLFSCIVVWTIEEPITGRFVSWPLGRITRIMRKWSLMPGDQRRKISVGSWEGCVKHLQSLTKRCLETFIVGRGMWRAG